MAFTALILINKSFCKEVQSWIFCYWNLSCHNHRSPSPQIPAKIARYALTFNDIDSVATQQSYWRWPSLSYDMRPSFLYSPQFQLLRSAPPSQPPCVLLSPPCTHQSLSPWCCNLSLSLSPLSLSPLSPGAANWGGGGRLAACQPAGHVTQSQSCKHKLQLRPHTRTGTSEGNFIINQQSYNLANVKN